MMEDESAGALIRVWCVPHLFEVMLPQVAEPLPRGIVEAARMHA